MDMKLIRQSIRLLPEILLSSNLSMSTNLYEPVAEWLNAAVCNPVYNCRFDSDQVLQFYTPLVNWLSHLSVQQEYSDRYRDGVPILSFALCASPNSGF